MFLLCNYSLYNLALSVLLPPFVNAILFVTSPFKTLIQHLKFILVKLEIHGFSVCLLKCRNQDFCFALAKSYTTVLSLNFLANQESKD